MRRNKILTSAWVLALLLGTAFSKNSAQGKVAVEEPLPNVTVVEIEGADLSDPNQFKWLEDNLFNSDQHWEIIARSYEGTAPPEGGHDCPQGKDCTDCNCNCVFEHGCADVTAHYHTFEGETRLYSVDGNGKVSYQDQVICQSGGDICLTNYLNALSKTLHYDDQSYVMHSDGSVFEGDELLSPSGGCQAVLDHIYDTSYQIYTYNYNGVELTYHVYPDGTVLDLSGNVVSTNGVSSLLTYIETTVVNTIQKVTYEIDGVPRTFTIVMGRVTEDPDNTLICSSGGADCLHQWVEDQMYSITQYSVGSTYYNFRIYPDGKVTDGDGVEVICETGGQQCLLSYFEEYVATTYQSTQVSYIINDEQISFLIFGSGRVETLVGESVICETGGQACLEDYVQSLMYSIAQYTVDGIVYNFHIYPDGKVEDHNGNVICETGGDACLAAHVEQMVTTLQTTQISYNINGVDNIFTIDYYGKVTDASGNVICETGGQDCLDAYVQSQMSSIIEYNIAGTVYTYEITNTGKVIQSDGTVICETGGQACLDVHIEQLTLSLQVTQVNYEVDGKVQTYLIDANGKVTYEDGTVICQSGGQACLDAYVQAQVYSVAQFNIGGTVYTFHVYQDGRVNTGDGVQICDVGEGQACLDAYVQNIVTSQTTIQQASGTSSTTSSSTIITYTIDGVEQQFTIHGDGSVVDAHGAVICASGGQACLEAWVQSQVASYQIVTVDVYGEQMQFYLYEDGSVEDVATGDVVCTSGGTTCLQGYLDALISSVSRVVFDINGVEYLFYIDQGTGEVTDEFDNVICATGGQACLQEYVQSITYSLTTINGVAYRIYPDGRVYNTDGTEMICETGGVDCLATHLGITLALGQEMSDSASKYSTLGALTVAVLLGGVYLFQKRQAKQQELVLENNIRQSLL